MAVTHIHEPHDVPAYDDASYDDQVRAPYRVSLEMAGFLTLLLGAWGGIVPYVGPVFGFSGDGTGSWTWSLPHSLLFLIPGAAACLAGLLMMIGGLSRHAVGRGIVAVGGILAVVCGAWFIVGPLAWPALEGSPFFVASSPLHQLAYWIGYSLGPGALLMAIGAFVLGRDRGEGVVVANASGRHGDARKAPAPEAAATAAAPGPAEPTMAGRPATGDPGAGGGWSTTPYAPGDRAAAVPPPDEPTGPPTSSSTSNPSASPVVEES